MSSQIQFSGATKDRGKLQSLTSLPKFIFPICFHSRSVISHRFEDAESTRHRRRASSNYSGGSMRSTRSNGSKRGSRSNRIHNSVQAQIERMFSDVASESVSCSFSVRCLGSLPLKDKITSLVGLQDPLRQLYLSGIGHGVS